MLRLAAAFAIALAALLAIAALLREPAAAPGAREGALPRESAPAAGGSAAPDAALAELRAGAEADTMEPPPAPHAFSATEVMTIKNVTVRASVADDFDERVRGLSGVAGLAANEVKLFVFETDGAWTIWMKDMRFPIDIIWADAEGEIVHVEERVAPETYPETFGPPVPVRYVIETSAGFVGRHGVSVGDRVTVPAGY